MVQTILADIYCIEYSLSLSRSLALLIRCWYSTV